MIIVVYADLNNGYNLQATKLTSKLLVMLIIIVFLINLNIYHDLQELNY